METLRRRRSRSGVRSAGQTVTRITFGSGEGGKAMSKRTVFAALACVVLVGLPPASASAGTLDQQQTSRNTSFPIGNVVWLAQVFTPALDGQLDRVDLLLSSLFPIGDLTVQIWSVAGGVPSSPIPG